MKLNWVERWVVNNPLRAMHQGLELWWMKRTMPINPGASVLEIGCGRGAGAARIMDVFRPSAICAMDLDQNMVLRARKYLSSQTKSRIFLYTGDAMYLPHEDGAFDCVFGFGVLHHIPDWRGALAEIARVLKPGGTYFLEELYPTLYQNFITKHILAHPAEDRFMGDDLEAALSASRFSVRDSFQISMIGLLAICVKAG